MKYERALKLSEEHADQLVFGLLSHGIRIREIAEWFNMGENDVRGKWTSACRAGTAKFRMELAKALYIVGIKQRNPSVLLHLAKVYLGHNRLLEAQLEPAANDGIGRVSMDMSRLTPAELATMADLERRASVEVKDAI